jgi:hypothetical protein
MGHSHTVCIPTTNKWKTINAVLYLTKIQTLGGHCNKTFLNVNVGFYTVSVPEYYSMGRIVLPACLPIWTQQNGK